MDNSVIRQKYSRLASIFYFVLAWAIVWPASGQQAGIERLPTQLLDVAAPSDRISGEPGSLRILSHSCSILPIEEVRSRIVSIAVQEWAYFGFSIYDLTTSTESRETSQRPQARLARLSAAESARVATSIAGYWAAVPDTGWILQRQNESWKARGMSSRWRDPWSAAFISWVMCESGLGDEEQFQRAIAHHAYIDQAITARDRGDAAAAFVAYDTGEQAINPGDLLCRGSRPAYQSLDQRRAQLGMGARTHCDIVVKLDQESSQIQVIGGNVRGSVRLKKLPAQVNQAGHLTPLPYNGRRLFAHLKLQASPLSSNALDLTPTLHAVSCTRELQLETTLALNLPAPALPLNC